MRFSPGALFIAVAACAMAQPVISTVVNNYNLVRPGLPNYGIAQGSIFAIYGSNFATGLTPLQVAPLKTTLDGVSVQITVSGVVEQAPLYYVGPTQIGGVLPSSTPVGNGQITVTVGSRTSAPAPITVVQSEFGIVTSPLSATTVSAFDANWNPLSSTNAVNPGDVIVFFGTGAGPITTDDSQTPPVQNLTNIPIEVDVGEIPATVLYHGRSGYPGLDQINIVVPAGVTGCQVSLAVVFSGLISNVAFIPVAQQGRTCSDQVPGGSLITTVTLNPSTTANTGNLAYTRTVQDIIPQGNPPPGLVIQSIQDIGSAFFPRVTYSQPTSFQFNIGTVYPSVGSCLTTSSVPSASNSAQAVAAVTREEITGVSYLNAGSAIYFSADSSSQRSIPLGSNGEYNGELGSSTGPFPPPLPLSAGGTITIGNASGGPDVGPFQAQINVNPPVALNVSALPPFIDRSKDLTISWTGGNPSGVVAIVLNSAVQVSGGYIEGGIRCEALVSSGNFTIPSSLLLSLPPGSLPFSNYTPPSNTISLTTEDEYSFSAPGIDYGSAFVDFWNYAIVTYI